MEEQGLILFFDGECGVCNTVVRWILDRDKHARFRFSPLQGEAAKRLPFRVDLSTVVLEVKGHFYTRSGGMLRALKYLPFPWPIFSLLLLVPPFVRNRAYDIFAKNRHRFAAGKACRLLTPTERTRFLV